MYCNIWKPIKLNQDGVLIQTPHFRLPLMRKSTDRQNFSTIEDFYLNIQNTQGKVYIYTNPGIFTLKSSRYLAEILDMVAYRQDLTFITIISEATSITNAIKYNSINWPENLKVRLWMQGFLQTMLRDFLTVSVDSNYKEIGFYNLSNSNIDRLLDELPEYLIEGKIAKVLIESSNDEDAETDIDKLSALSNLCKENSVKLEITKFTPILLKNGIKYWLNPVERISQVKKSGLNIE